MVDFGANILAVRTQLKLSRAAFAADLGVSSDKIKSVEMGRQRADHELLAALRNVFNVDLNDLFEGRLQEKLASSGAEFARIRKMTVSIVGDNEGYFYFDSEWISTRNLDPDNIRAFVVQGDSMAPNLHAGNLILFDITQTDAIQGKTYVVQVGAAIVVNYIKHLAGGKIRFLSANNIYGHIDYDPASGNEDFKILGRVVASLHEW